MESNLKWFFFNEMKLWNSFPRSRVEFSVVYHSSVSEDEFESAGIFISL